MPATIINPTTINTLNKILINFRWDRKSNLRFPRCYCNLVSVNDTLYLCGGATRAFTSSNSVISSLQSIDTYNKEQDVWEHCTDMVIPRHAAGTASLGMYHSVIGTFV